MRCSFLAFVAMFVFITTTAAQAAPTLNEVGSDPTTGYSILHEDISLSLRATGGVLSLPNLFGENASVGYADLRARATVRVWRDGTDVSFGGEVRGFAASDNDGLGGEGLGPNSLLDRRRLGLYAVMALESQPELSFLSSQGPALTYDVVVGVGVAYRDLLEEEFLGGGFAEVDLTLRPQGSQWGGFFQGELDLLLEELGRAANFGWSAALGAQWISTGVVRRVRLGATAFNINYGDVYRRSGVEREDILRGDVFVGAVASAQLGPVSLTLRGGYAHHVTTSRDVGGSVARDRTSASLVEVGLRLDF